MQEKCCLYGSVIALVSGCAIIFVWWFLFFFILEILLNSDVQAARRFSVVCPWLWGFFPTTPSSFYSQRRVCRGDRRTRNSKFDLRGEWERKRLRPTSLFAVSVRLFPTPVFISSLLAPSSPPPPARYSLALSPTLGLIFHHLYHNNISSFSFDFFFQAISSLASLQIKAIKSPLITPTSPPLIYLFLSPLISIWYLSSRQPHSSIRPSPRHNTFVPPSWVTLPCSLSAQLAFLIFILYCWFTHQITTPPQPISSPYPLFDSVSSPHPSPRKRLCNTSFLRYWRSRWYGPGYLSGPGWECNGSVIG